MLIVKKFGGSSLAEISDIRRSALIVKDSYEKGEDIVVVVSAMGKSTDRLITLAKSVSNTPQAEATDLLLSTGEMVSASLFTMMLCELGLPAIALTAFSAGIKTDNKAQNATILDIDTSNIRKALNDRKVVVVAGFQGHFENTLTTIGRGGSDTTATALAYYLKADRCIIYTDVEGVFSADPNLFPCAIHIPEISYKNMLLLSRFGAKVMHWEAVKFASIGRFETQIVSSFTNQKHTTLTHNCPVNSVLAVASMKAYQQTIEVKKPINLWDIPLNTVENALCSIDSRASGNVLNIYTEQPLPEYITQNIISLCGGEAEDFKQREVTAISVIGDELPRNNRLVSDILEKIHNYNISRLFTYSGCCRFFTEQNISEIITELCM